MGNGRVIGGDQGFAARFGAGVAAAAEFGEIFDGGANAGDQFVNLRPAFPAIGNLVGARPHLVWTKGLQVLALAVERAHVVAEEFVGRADEEIAVEGFDVDQAVRA